ncbi:ABC transporter permease [candidate division KSB1 bacterium]
MSIPKKSMQPPRIAERILSGIFPDRGWYTSLGDFREEFAYIAADRGLFRAQLWYWGQLLRSVGPFLCNLLYWSGIMVRYAIKYAVRILRRYKGYSCVNIAGLSIGIASCLLIGMYISFETSYDDFHTHADQIYRYDTIVQDGDESRVYDSTFLSIGPALAEQFPEINAAARFYFKGGAPVIQYGDKRFYEENFTFGDKSIFDVFSLRLIKGRPETVFQMPTSIVISEKTAEKYFGSDDPVGKTLGYFYELYDMTGRIEFTVTGVFRDIPSNSTLKADFIAFFDSVHDAGVFSKIMGEYIANFFTTYVLVDNTVSIPDLEEKLVQFNKTTLEKTYGPNKTGSVKLTPLISIHLSKPERVKALYTFGGIGLMILFIACINYVNLTTARSAHRAMEIGIKKVVGAKRIQLMVQFLGESVIIAFIALCAALLLTAVMLPLFRGFLGIDIYFVQFLTPGNILFALISVCCVGVLSGSYPALFLSAFRPLLLMKKITVSGRSAQYVLRKILVVLQFAISVILVTATLFISKQVKFMRDADLDFEKDNIIILEIKEQDMIPKIEVIKRELLDHPNILGVSATLGVPPDLLFIPEKARKSSEEPSKSRRFDLINVDDDFITAYGMSLQAGRDFSPEIATDKDNAIIINEKAASLLGLTDPVGQEILLSDRKHTIIGVVRDFHFRSLKNEMTPYVLALGAEVIHYISVKIHPENSAYTLEHIKKIWDTHAPDFPLSYSFLDDDIFMEYNTEENFGKAFQYSALLALFISCLGLFGLSAFLFEQRTKEVCIRKVLGESIHGIIILFSREFIKLILTAIVIAVPPGYLIVSRWLQNYPFRIEIDLITFVFSGAVTLVIAFSAISYQAVRAARSNPVDSLRYE